MKKINEKHLEFIQNVINRLAGNSFLIKGWAITVLSAGFGYYLTSKITLSLLVLIFITFMFWLIDVFYLRQERLFRELYKGVVEGNEKRDFTLDTTPYKRKVKNLFLTLFSFPNGLPYLMIILFTVSWYLAKVN